MGRTAEEYLNVWRSWIGYSEANGKYKEIIDLYNRSEPLPRGYKVSYKDAWCDVTVSAAAIAAGIADLTGKECGCEEHIRIFKEKGIWTEDGSIIPEPGYLIVYNWNDGEQPNDGYSDHIGIVESVRGNRIICIEGNYKDSVARREIPVGWGYIRGYAALEYESEAGKEDHETEEQAPDRNGKETDHVKKEESSVTQKDTLKKECEWIGIVTVNSWLNVRKWAGTRYETCSFSPLMNGTEVEVCDCMRAEDGEDWYYIKYKGKYGFVHAGYVQKK